MRVLLAISFPILWLAGGQASGFETRTLRSYSGQFLVRGLAVSAPAPARPPGSEASYVRLDPTLLAVSCERIKSALLDELRIKDFWKGRIHILLHPVREDGEPIVITSTRFIDGWNYHMDMPEQVDQARLIRSILEVLLLETANRRAGLLQADIPLWLTEGLTAHLQATGLAGFTLEPETRVARNQKGYDPLAAARQRLGNHPPLTFGELTWPGEEQLALETLATYQSCAQLFVSELLRLRDGRECIREMLARLGEKLNWQTAFLGAFSKHIERLIDVDKWWSLHVVHFTGHGLASIWTTEESLNQLDKILITPVQIRLSAGELPFTTQATPQSIIREWDYQRQRALLQQKISLLAALRMRANQDAVQLVENYRQGLDLYLQRRGKSDNSARKAELSPGAKIIVNETTKRLDALDFQRESLRRKTNPPPAQLTTSR